MSELEPNPYLERPIDVLSNEIICQTAANQLDDYFRLLAKAKTTTPEGLAIKSGAALEIADSLARSGLPLADNVKYRAISLAVSTSTNYVYRRNIDLLIDQNYNNATVAGIKMLAICDLPVPRETLEQLAGANRDSLWSLRNVMKPEPADFKAIEMQWNTSLTRAEKLALKINARKAKMRYGGSRLVNGIYISQYQSGLN